MARGPSRKGMMTIELSGPFFRGDPVKTYRQNIRDLQAEVAKVGEAEVKARLYPSASSASVGHLVQGRTQNRRSGQTWATYAVVSTNTSALGAAGAIRAQAIMSGRRLGSHGTTVGAKGRQAFSSAYRAFNRVVRSFDLFRGL